MSINIGFDEFKLKLADCGAKNIEFSKCEGVEKSDSLEFEINGIEFYVTSMRGGEVLGGSMLIFSVKS